MKMDPKSSFMRSDSASVQSTDSRGKIVKNSFTFLARIIVVYIIIITSLVQISLRSPDKELCLILLSSSIGYILPSPCLKFRKQSLPGDRTRLKIETMKDFYLTLLSDSSLRMCPDNKQNSITLKLDHPIQIKK